MIYFFADSHYGVNPGKHIFESLGESLKKRIVFTEDSWELLESCRWGDDCELLVLNMIAGTCGQPMPGSGAEKAVRKYCEKGGNILLLHGSSAAFWEWAWWREIVGLRWVRPNDPDGVAASTHPVKAYKVIPAKARHELAGKLKEMDFESDEIYINLEQTVPLMILMTTHIEEGIFPQCCEAISPWGGKIVSFIPGHKPEATTKKELIFNVDTIIKYLLKGSGHE